MLHLRVLPEPAAARGTIGISRGTEELPAGREARHFQQVLAIGQVPRVKRPFEAELLHSHVLPAGGFPPDAQRLPLYATSAAEVSGRSRLGPVAALLARGAVGGSRATLSVGTVLASRPAIAGLTGSTTLAAAATLAIGR